MGRGGQKNGRRLIVPRTSFFPRQSWTSTRIADLPSCQILSKCNWLPLLEPIRTSQPMWNCATFWRKASDCPMVFQAPIETARNATSRENVQFSNYFNFQIILIFQFSNFQIFKFSIFKIFNFSNVQFFKYLNFQIFQFFQFSNISIFLFSNFQIFKFSIYSIVLIFNFLIFSFFGCRGRAFFLFFCQPSHLHNPSIFSTRPRWSAFSQDHLRAVHCHRHILVSKKNNQIMKIKWRRGRPICLLRPALIGHLATITSTRRLPGGGRD